MKVAVKRVNAFTDFVLGGNPAGVVLNSPKLTDKQMAHVSKVLNVSETAFVFPSRKADYKVRFFTPEIEVDLCGHATIATFFTMALDGLKKSVVTQETKAGILPVSIIFSDRVDKVMMNQGRPIFKDIFLDISKLASSLKISRDDIDNTLPKQKVSTGLFTLPICIKSYDALKSIKPDFYEIKKICNDLGVGSFHLFTFDTLDPKSVYHARNFAPVYGINEDPATGTANGAVCSYLVKNKIVKGTSFVCEQGDIIGRSGRVFVELDKDSVKVGGRAVIVDEVEIQL